MKRQLALALPLCAAAIAAEGQIAKTSDNMMNQSTPTEAVIYGITDAGETLNIDWGMDTAWDWDRNVLRGVCHIGKGNFATGRVSFQPTSLVTDNGDGTYTLTAAQQSALQSRIDHIKLTGTTKANINCDHDVMKETGTNGKTGFENYKGKPENWYKLIKASVQYCQAHGLEIISVSPMNEPDYAAWNEGTMADFLNICKLLKNDKFFDGIRICGGNTLNCDQAMPWYSYLKNYIDEGNTHQLAGSMDSYINFHKTVKADGKACTNDELHNVVEGIVGANYGMTTGIWWAFDAIARGQFCKDSNEGKRIGYAENKNTWTAAAVYRNEKENQVHAFIGSSERQAGNASYAFISKDIPVSYNGYAPTQAFVADIKGGTGYQKGQINAEKMIDITYGEDIPQGHIDGTYCIMNVGSKRLLGMADDYNNVDGVRCFNKIEGDTKQQWNVTPQEIAGDCSYWVFTLKDGTNNRLDLLDYSLESGASAIIYSNKEPNDAEQWFLRYAGDGSWYILARYSNKALYCSTTMSNGASVQVGDLPQSESARNKYKWRFIPVDAACELAAPAQPKNLTAKEQSMSIMLEWTANTESDLLGYNILRSEADNDDYYTIACSVNGNAFIDNSVVPGKQYTYKIVAVDVVGNRSEQSATATASTTTKNMLVAQYLFNNDTEDCSENRFDAICSGKATFSSSIRKEGTNALSLAGVTNLQLPSNVANFDEMTISTWVRWSTASSWQRIFDFANSTSQYMFLCPEGDGNMRFVMKNGGSEQILKAPALTTGAWHHIAVTIANDKVVLYFDGSEVASSTSFTIKPSDIKPSFCYIGRSIYASDPLFKGWLDDLRIYNYALGANDITKIMDNPGAATDVAQVESCKDVKAVEYYSITGMKVTQPTTKGVYIKRTIYNDGTSTSKKISMK